jgi:hypothetical protein
MPVLERSVAYGWPQDGGPSEWMDSAACGDSSVELFFPAKGESYAHAKSICGRCPVVEQCRAAIDWAERELKSFGRPGFLRWRDASRPAEAARASGPLTPRSSSRSSSSGGLHNKGPCPRTFHLADLQCRCGWAVTFCVTSVLTRNGPERSIGCWDVDAGRAVILRGNRC